VIYGDSSFVLRLLCHEAGSEEAVALYRRLGRPVMAFSPLHELEVRNGLRLKAFIEKGALPPARRTSVDRELKAWESRLERYLNRGALQAMAADWSPAAEQALTLSAAHTLKLGTRTYDILHVAFALTVNCRDFITCDIRQAALAKAAGLKVTLVETDS